MKGGGATLFEGIRPSFEGVPPAPTESPPEISSPVALFTIDPPADSNVSLAFVHHDIISPHCALIVGHGCIRHDINFLCQVPAIKRKRITR